MDDETVVGYKNISLNEFWVVGHFPNFPIMPGALLIETLSQVGGFCFLNDFLSSEKKYIGYIVGYDKVRFYRKTFPGDVLEFRVKKIAKYGNVGKVSGVAYAKKVYENDWKLVLKAEVTYKFEQIE